MALAAEQLLRADALLRDELARLHGARLAMTPAATATVSAVLTALAKDPDINPAVAAEAHRVLDALLERPARRLPPQHLFGLRATRLRAA